MPWNRRKKVVIRRAVIRSELKRKMCLGDRRKKHSDSIWITCKLFVFLILLELQTSDLEADQMSIWKHPQWYITVDLIQVINSNSERFFSDSVLQLNCSLLFLFRPTIPFSWRVKTSFRGTGTKCCMHFVSESTAKLFVSFLFNWSQNQLWYLLISF